MPLADTLLRLAAGPGLFRPKWSDQIMAEVSRTLQQNFNLSPQKAAYRESQIRQHFPEALIDGYEDLIPQMTNHPKDRHVLAAAVGAGVKLIVTYNLKDFPPRHWSRILLRFRAHQLFSAASMSAPLLNSCRAWMRRLQQLAGAFITCSRGCELMRPHL